MNAPNTSKSWRIKNSLWIIWSFTIILSPVGFFYIGAKTKKLKWIISGVIYFLLGPVALYFSGKSESGFVPSSVGTALGFIWFFSFIACIVHSFIVRKSYLNLISSESSATAIPVVPVSSSTNKAPVLRNGTPEEKILKVNINTSSEKMISDLPGVGIAIANRAVAIRSNSGPYTSVNEFITRLDIPAHFSEQIEHLATVNPEPEYTTAIQTQPLSTPQVGENHG